MKIQIENIDLNNEWDYQKAKLLLEWSGLDSSGLENDQRKELEEKVTLFIWDNIKKQFPDVEKFCTEKTGYFNEPDKRNYNTPIINIYGSFYMQLISEHSKDAWCWESIDLEPYRFYFNETDYFKDLVKDAIIKAKNDGYTTTRFNKLSEALKIDLNYI